MAGVLYLLDAQRLIDRDGIAAGGQIYFYHTGTSVLAPIYTDSGLTTPAANPVVADAAGAIPDVYLDSSVTYRRYIVYPDGSTNNADPYSSLGIVLVGPDGTDQIGYQAPGSTYTQTLFSKLSQTYSFKDAGCVGDGITDDTVAAQAAIDFCITNGTALEHTGGIIRTTAPLVISGGVTIQGHGGIPYKQTITSTYQQGGWFHFDHAGVGIQIGNGTLLSGVRLYGFGTIRSQPTPSSTAGVAFTPGSFDYDIVINNTDVIMDDITLLNPTKGIDLINGSAGRLTLGLLRGQPLTIGINIENSLDIFTANLIDWWPYWQNNANVHAWTLANRDGIWLNRVDGPMLGKLFDIFGRSAVRLSQNTDGKTTKLMIDSLYADGGNHAVWMDSTCNAVIGQISKLAAQCYPGQAGTIPILMEGSNSQLDVSLLRTDASGLNAVSMTGTANYLQIDSASVNNWNQDAIAGTAAFNVAGTGNTLRLANKPITSGGGTGVVYSTTGTIEAPDRWSSYVPAITDVSGSITTGTLNFQYKVSGNVVDIDFSIGSPTTGTGALFFQLPFPATAPAAGSARESATGKMCSVNIANAATTAQIQVYDNTYPGSSGATISGSVRYRS